MMMREVYSRWNGRPTNRPPRDFRVRKALWIIDFRVALAVTYIVYANATRCAYIGFDIYVHVHVHNYKSTISCIHKIAPVIKIN